jgi:hypothetical protein
MLKAGKQFFILRESYEKPYAVLVRSGANPVNQQRAHKSLHPSCVEQRVDLAAEIKVQNQAPVCPYSVQ